MEDDYFKKLTTTMIILILVVLSFLLLKPILMSIIAGFLLAFVFSPIYNLLVKATKSKPISAGILVVVLLALIVLPLWFFTPTLINESIKLYLSSQKIDLVSPLKALMPSLFASVEFSHAVDTTIHSFITNVTNSLMNYFANIISDIPNIIAQILVIFFTFYYALRDKEDIFNYIKSLLPFSKEVQKKLFDSTSGITFSVLYGQILIGVIQGLILGVGFFVFGVPNPFLITLLAIGLCALPIIGPTFIGVPVAFIFLIQGNSFSAIGILIFTAISSISDHFIRPPLVAKLAKLHTALVLIGMVGGFILFGLLGFVLGPMILAYLIIIAEIYRTKTVPDVLIQEPDRKK